MKIPATKEAIEFCIDDFYQSLADACEKAGGNPDVMLKTRRVITLDEVAHILAVNGVRFTTNPRRSISSVIVKEVLAYKD